MQVSRFITRPVNRSFEIARCFHVLSINSKTCITVLRNDGNFNRRHDVITEKPLMFSVPLGEPQISQE